MSVAKVEAPQQLASSPSPQQDEDETHHTESDNEQEISEEESRAQVSQARLSQTRRNRLVNLLIHQGWLWPRQPNRNI